MVSRIVFDSRPNKANMIVITVLIIVHSEEEDGGDDCSDLDQLGVGWLADFDLKVFSCCFEERGKFFSRHGVGDDLPALL